MRKLAIALALSAFCWSSTAGVAGVVYQESVAGDLSANAADPTKVTIATGVNSVIGTTANLDRDYLTFNVPIGSQLTAITLAGFTSTDDIAFAALAAGTSAPSPSAPNLAGLLLGYTHFGTATSTLGDPVAHVGENTLIKMGTALGAIGFTVPLGPGDYTLWIQQTNAQSVAYQFDIAVVPEPSAWALLGIGLVGLMLARPRPRQSMMRPQP